MKWKDRDRIRQTGVNRCMDRWDIHRDSVPQTCVGQGGEGDKNTMCMRPDSEAGRQWHSERERERQEEERRQIGRRGWRTYLIGA